jgi:hypothetical protein
MAHRPVRAIPEAGSRQKFLYCPLNVKSTKALRNVSVAAMEYTRAVKMDSKPAVCYMNFGVRGFIRAGFVFPKEHRIAF